MPSRTIIGVPIQQGETFTYTATIRNEAGVVVDLPAATTAATLTFYRADTNAVINGRISQDIRGLGTGANNHSLTSSGVLTWKSVPNDTSFIIASDTKVVARYEITYNDAQSVSRVGVHEVEFTIQVLPVVS